MNQKLVFVDHMAFPCFADEGVPRLDLLKRSEPDVTVTVSRAVPEVPADRGCGEMVAV